MTSQASFFESAAVALSSLRASKLRSFLTLLGIILATTTLIAVMSVIEGMNLYIAQQVSDMGSEGFRVRRIIMIGNFDAKKFMEAQRRNPEMSRGRVRVCQVPCKACAGIRHGGLSKCPGEVRAAVARLDPVHGLDAKHGGHLEHPDRKRPIHQRER